MRVFLLWFVRVGDLTAQLTNMCDTSLESWDHGAVYRLLYIVIAFIYCEYKAKSKVAFYGGPRNSTYIGYSLIHILK